MKCDKISAVNSIYNINNYGKKDAKQEINDNDKVDKRSFCIGVGMVVVLKLIDFIIRKF